ncbi:MAG: GNAT family N-acetyltransferase [Rickettsiaceae bacterium]|nr:GNAT family N-acetyltransferase [Rickettsiaceae bacterium]
MLPQHIKTGDFIAVGAYYNGQLVATASIVIDDDGIAGFYNDSTLEQYRNKGIATKLYHYRLKLIKNMGIKQAIVQTSPMATSLAKKVGFTQVTNYKIYMYE